MVNTTERTLPQRDQSVLDLVFHPEAAPSKLLISASATEAPDTDPGTLQQAKTVELEAVRLAEKGRLGEAIDLLTAAMDIAPRYASLYNNRAQAFRLQREAASALADLSTAIELATPTSPSTPLHPKVARVLAQAYTQRAALLHSGAKLPNITAEQREDALAHDLFMGGQYGNELAKSLSVALNPYSKMCGAIIQQSLTDEYRASLKA